jgi:septum formation protein
VSRLVLASRSPARAAILAQAGVAFDVEAADVDEAALKRRYTSEPVPQIAAHLAAAKALAAIQSPDDWVLGADQTLELDGVLFDKPGSVEALAAQLASLQGRRHALHSAWCLASGGRIARAGVETAHMTMRAFSDNFLQAYVATEGAAAQQCVGGYRLEGLGVQLFERVEGDYFTVLGLPLFPVLNALRQAGLLPS